MNRCVAALMLGILPTVLIPIPTDASPAASSPATQGILEQDPRLAAKVTVRLKRSPLSAVVAELGRQAGVELKAVPEVADEPAIVYATDQPVKSLMHHLATLFSYRWMRAGTPGQYRYELHQDLKSRQEEEAARQGDRLRAVAALQQALRLRVELARRSPEQLLHQAAANDAAVTRFEQAVAGQEAAAEQSPEYQSALQRAAWSYSLREMADPMRRALVGAVALLSEAQWSALMAGETIQFSTRPEADRIPVPAVLAGELRAALPSWLPAGEKEALLTPEEAEGQRQEEAKTQDHWQRAEELRLTVRLELAAAGQDTRATLMVTPSAIMPPGHEGEIRSFPSLVVTGVASKAIVERRAAEREEAAAWAADPVLGAKRRWGTSPPAPLLGGEGGLGRGAGLVSAGAGAVRRSQAAGRGVSLNDLLGMVAETYGVNLVADGYRAEPLERAPAEGEEKALYSLLEEFVAPDADWRREGPFLQVRRHAWQYARLAEIPDRVAKEWTARLRLQSGSLSLDDAAALAGALRDEQLAGFAAVMRDEGIRVRGMFDTESDDEGGQQLPLLRAYASLLPGQRQALKTGGWVAGVAMPPEARRWLQAALRARQQGQASAGDWGDAASGALGLTAMPARGPERDRSGREGVPARDGQRRVQFRWQSANGQEELFPVILPAGAANRLAAAEEEAEQE